LWATVIVAIIITLNLLWLLTTFWSYNYVGEHKLIPLFYYHLYRFPLLLALGLAFWAWWKQQPVWLSGAIFLSNFWSFYTLAAVHTLRDQLATPELIRQAPLLNVWVVFAFFSLSIMTFFVYWTTRYFQTRQYSFWVKILCLIVIIISMMDILIGNLNTTIYSPLFYYFGGSKMSFFEQAALLMRAFPHLILAILAVWFILEKKYSYFGLHVIMGYYYIFHTDFLIGLEHSWGETDMLARANQISSITNLAFYAIVTVIFFIWFFYWAKHQINKEH
jgi:hypothetical protein